MNAPAAPAASSSAASPLPYSTQVPWHQRVPPRAIVAVTALLALAVSAMLWGPRAWHTARVMYWQSRCLRYEANHTFTPVEWTNYYRLLSPPGFKSIGTVFLHERVSPCGNRRLVVVELAPYEPRETLLRARVFVPGGLTSRPSELAQGRDGLSLPDYGEIRAGRPDPHDRSHFTFACEIAGRKNVIDGWLGDDDLVRLEPRAPLN